MVASHQISIGMELFLLHVSTGLVPEVVALHSPGDGTGLCEI